MMDLAEQHILQSESHLRRIDEMMARAREAEAKTAAAEPLLSRIELDRDRLASELADLRRRASSAEAGTTRERAAGLEGALRGVGIELEKTLTAILGGR